MSEFTTATGVPAWVTDRWIGKAWSCWMCGSEERWTKAITFIPAATLDGDEGVRRPLWAYVPACARCTVILLTHGMIGSGYQPPDLRMTLDQLLAENPLDGPCDLCDAGKKPPAGGPCICRKGRRMLHGWTPGEAVAKRLIEGTEFVGPTPGPLWPCAIPLADSAWGKVQHGGGGAADTSGPWDTEGIGVSVAPAAEVPGPEPVPTPATLLERRLARGGGTGGPPRRPLRG